jgi:hypothetical protein
MAADLDRRTSGVPSCLTGFYFPPYFGLAEPWSQSEERPPRRGVWWSTQRPTSGVNALVPMRKDFRCVRPEPWTPAWYAYCAARYPSFNPDSGTIRTADGPRMCK